MQKAPRNLVRHTCGQLHINNGSPWRSAQPRVGWEWRVMCSVESHFCKTAWNDFHECIKLTGLFFQFEELNEGGVLGLPWRSTTQHIAVGFFGYVRHSLGLGDAWENQSHGPDPVGPPTSRFTWGQGLLPHYPGLGEQLCFCGWQRVQR